MRLYSFVNMYMEGIHAGIQTAHVQGEIHAKYQLQLEGEVNQLIHGKDVGWNSLAREKLSMYNEWERNHKVIQVYNGGYSSSLRQRFLDLEVYAHHFNLPYAKFHEGQDALDGALTAVGIIVPEHLYDRKNREAEPESAEGAFYALLHSCKHAR